MTVLVSFKFDDDDHDIIRDLVSSIGGYDIDIEKDIEPAKKIHNPVPKNLRK